MAENVENRPSLLVIAGPNGAGKTSFTKQFLSLHLFDADKYVNADDIAQTMPGGWHNPENFYPAAQEADRLREMRLENGQDIAFETVYSSPGKLDFVRRAKTKGYFVSMVFLCADNPSIHAARVCQRVMQNGHSVPIEKIISRYARSIEFAAKSIEHLSVGYFLDSTENDAEPRMVAKIVTGRAFLSGYQPAWMMPIEDRCHRLLHIEDLSEHVAQLQHIATHPMGNPGDGTHQNDVRFAGPMPSADVPAECEVRDTETAGAK
jgi:predicted ABC-type ATPase